MAYASRTGTRRNLRVMREAGWRLMVEPSQIGRYKSMRPLWDDGSDASFAVDNGAWGSHCRGEVWDPAPFLKMVDAIGDRADWIVVPDIVEGGRASLRRSIEWLDRLPGLRLVAVQDGLEPTDLGSLVGPSVGIFVGGSTEWKLSTLPQWGRFARERGVYLHVGRVNTRRRIRACALAGADSFDGSSVTRFAKTIVPLEAERRQEVLSLD